MLPEDHSIEVKDQQYQVVQAPFAQTLELRLAGLDRFPAHAGPRHPHRLGHLRQHLLVLPSRHAAQQDLQHPAPQLPVGAQRFISRNRNLTPFLLPPSCASAAGSPAASVLSRRSSLAPRHASRWLRLSSPDAAAPPPARPLSSAP